MVYSLTYRRPAFVSGSRESLSDDEKQRSIHESIGSSGSCMSRGIPPALSFDRIVSGGTCPPVTLRDFMNYLKYIEYSAENLQFYLWYRDYVARWAKLPAGEQALSPEWTQAQADADHHRHHPPGSATKPKPPQHIPSQLVSALRDTDFAAPSPRIAPLPGSPTSASLDDRRDLHPDAGSSLNNDEKALISPTPHHILAEQAFEDAGMRWQPFTPQPFRLELTHIISTYLSPASSPRELNLSSRERRAALHALQHTTHPSALAAVARTVECSLRRQAHPNFVRWAICNGNRPRVLFARGLGVGTLLAALAVEVALTLSRAGRGWRVMAFPLWFVGIATLVAAWKGMCVVLHGLHHRHLRPWELFGDEGGEEEEGVEGMEGKGLGVGVMQGRSLESVGSNSFEEEPWVPRYRERNVIRKVFDREVWVREPALRQVQDTIFLQAVIVAGVGAGVMVGIFCAVPKGDLY